MSRKKFSRREIELKTLMLQMGVTNVEVAKKNKCSSPFVSMYIKGIRKSEKLDKFFEGLKNEYDDMMDRFMMQVRYVEKNKTNLL